VHDKIFIKNLVIPCKIGLYEKERRRKQDVIIDVEIFHNLKEAGVTDNIRKTINYSELTLRITKLVSGCESRLLENIAQNIASLVLKDSRTRKVTVRVRKKKYSRNPLAGIEITRLQHG
jgi:FolB domain-containing protein